MPGGWGWVLRLSKSSTLGYRVYELEKKPCIATPGVRVYREGDGVVLENEHLRVVINNSGGISSMKLAREGVEVLGGESNKLVVYIDKARALRRMGG